MNSSTARDGRHLRSERTVQALVSVARVAFVERNYEDVTVRQLAAQAGVRASLICYHFGGKEGLYYEILDLGLQSLQERLRKELSLGGEFAARLERVAAACEEHLRADPDLCRLLASGTELGQERIDAALIAHLRRALSIQVGVAPDAGEVARLVARVTGVVWKTVRG